ncbi:hypothetical protein IGI04_007118 [Brassica rapa subsp. trilocularis]|uniref:SGS domain-containing protein n=1 Tax=Brassica rapa subsp. trilocularis TaxID=1813537 RepID=A0ABQ7NIW8_BRACM|nr:hypothetical protein IGI04_007118 [Brassica rapa subsp. trilocularis]
MCVLYKIIPEKCIYKVLSTKVQIRLAKAEIISLGPLLNIAKAKLFCLNPCHIRPVYPSSKPRKESDKLEAEVKKQEKDEKLDGDAATNMFFSDIYQSAEEDMRRAMNKSFEESNGTVLSPNWEEVGTKKVESTPPDGIELKKWEYLFKYSFLCLVNNSDKYLNFNLFWFLLEFSLHSCGAV